MNMKNIIKNKQKELMQGMIALILCVALFCSAAVSGKNDGSEWKMRMVGRNMRRRELMVGCRHHYMQEFLQNFARMRWQFCRTTRRFLRKQQSVQRRRRHIQNRASTHFYRDRSPGQRDGHGRGSGRTSMSEAITSAISDAVCAVWQISTARLRSIHVLRGTCTNMRGRCPAMHHRGRSGQSAGRI